MAIGTKTLAPSELDTFEDQRLVEELRKAKEELFNLRFQQATGQLDNPTRIREVRRDVARIATVLREREIEAELDAFAAAREELAEPAEPEEDQ